MKRRLVKRLTRENTLLDRAFRSCAYAESIPTVGRARLVGSVIYGQRGLTSLYEDVAEAKWLNRMILRESQRGIDGIGKAILKLLAEAYSWGKHWHSKGLNRKELVAYVQQFMRYHAYGRGAIVYGYWGEPPTTQQLKRSLAPRLGARTDELLSVLSTPRAVSGELRALYHTSALGVGRRSVLLKKLRANERALAHLLPWFTLFYELGERVSSYLYDELLKHLRRAVKSGRLFSELMWYDPESLLAFLARGKRLSLREITDRKGGYALLMQRGRLNVSSGPRAQRFYRRNLEEHVRVNQRELRGTPASPGTARGEVCIVVTQADQKKMRRGNILVSTMTTPRLMAAVRLARAIVTDEGGLTAHAAIVSRELGIPCIVGTKFATRVFKNGEKVLVDATNGIVRKL